MKTALFTVSYAGLWGQHSLNAVECVHKTAALGFEGILFMAKKPHISPLDIQEAELKELERALDESGIKTVGLAAYTDFLMPAPAEIPILDLQIAYIEACCRSTARLKGDIVRLFTGYTYPQSNRQASWNTIVSTLRLCGDIAQKYAVRLAVQNHHDLAVGTEEMALLLDEVNHPAVSAGYDAWSPFLRGEDLGVGAKRMAKRTIMTIAANYKRYPRFSYQPDFVNYTREFPDNVRATLMDQGDIDYEPFLSELRDNGFDGWVVYETCSPLIGGGAEKKLDHHAKNFLSYMTNFHVEK